MDKKLAQVAAKWWADHLRNGATLDNGDRSEIGFKTHMLATILQAKERDGLDNIKIDSFEVELAKIIEGEDEGWFSMGVDYHPGTFLQNAADNVDLHLGMATLPWKTMMWIRNGEITVAEGYQSSPQQIYP